MTQRNRKSIGLLFILAILISTLMVGVSYGQSSASVRGTVADSQGAAVKGATITLQSESKSFSRTQISNADGNYSFNAIPPDSYRLEVVANGFKKSVVSSVKAMIDSTKELDVVLEIGGISETVTVTSANEAVLNTSDGSIGNTFNTQQILQLPLSARDRSGRG